MGWKDAPVEKKSAWESAPVVPIKPKKPPKKEDRSLLSQFGHALAVDLGGLVKGAAAIPDALTNLAGTVMGTGVRYAGKAGGALSEAVGLGGKDIFGNDIRQKGESIARNLGNPITIRRVSDAVAPQPRTIAERYGETISEGMGGLATSMGAGSMLAKGSNALGRKVGAMLLEKPAQQMVGIATGAASYQGAKEAGAPVPVQIGAGLVGGVAGTMGANKFMSLREAMRAAPKDQIISDAQQAGVRLMTSDVRQPKTFMGKQAQSIGEKIPLAGTGGVRAAQQAERVGAVKTVLRDYGGNDMAAAFDDAPTALNDVSKSLSAQRGRELTRLTGDKTAIINQFDAPVPVAKAVQAIDKQIAGLTALKSPELQPVITKLQGWKTALENQPLKNVEELRKIMGSAFDDPGLAGVKSVGQKSVNAIYEPLRDDMGDFIKAQGGMKAFQTWKNANDKLAGMAGELNNSALRNVLKTNEMTPENVGRLLFSKNKSDVERLYNNLDAFGKSRAQAAVLQRAFDKSISADQGLSIERFVNNVTGMGDTVGVVFRGADKRRIEGLARVLDATRRAAAASASPPTGVQNTPMVAGYTIASIFGQVAIPVAGLGGLFARMYESAPVRNILLNLAKTEPGSAREAVLINRAIAAMKDVKIPKALNDNVGVSVAAGDAEKDQQKQQ